MGTALLTKAAGLSLCLELTSSSVSFNNQPPLLCRASVNVSTKAGRISYPPSPNHHMSYDSEALHQMPLLLLLPLPLH